MFEKEVFKKHDYKLNYAIDYPENFSKDEKYPVIFYFHGMGQVPGDVDLVIDTCPVR